MSIASSNDERDPRGRRGRSRSRATLAHDDRRRQERRADRAWASGRRSSGLAASICCSRIPADLRRARCSPSTTRRGSRRLTCCCSARCAWCARSCPRCGSAAAAPSSCRLPRRSRSRSPNLGLSTVVRASVSALAKTLAIELAASGIRVNQIIPGRVDTDRVRQLDDITGKKQGITPDQAKARSRSRTIPLGRYGEPPEFGRVARVSALGRAAYMTGCDRAGRRRPDQERVCECQLDGQRSGVDSRGLAAHRASSHSGSSAMLKADG